MAGLRCQSLPHCDCDKCGQVSSTPAFGFKIITMDATAGTELTTNPGLCRAIAPDAIDACTALIARIEQP